jgi:signal transduction histidine kinase
VGVVYLAAVGAVAYTSVVRLGDATERATRTHIVLRLLDETFAFVAGAETGSRGYVITGDTQYLEPYRNAETEAATRLKSLETAIDDHVQQHEQLRRLVPLVARRFSLLDESVRLRADKGFDDAVFPARTERGRLVMDSIRALVDSISAEETTQLQARSVQERRSLRRAAALIGLSFFAAVTLGLAAALFVSRDIGRRLRAEEEARHAKEVAEAASRAKSEFLAMMSHELRTPLNSVIGFSNVLLRNRTGNLRERDLLYLQRIRAGGQHLLSLINEVLDLSKIEAGRMQVERTPVLLDALIEDTIASFEGQLRGRPIVLAADLPRHTTPIDTDPAKLLQVLTNLIGNAIKFTERGSVTVRIVADVVGRPERIDVVDTGIGIPSDRQQAIFDAFEQADSSTARQFGGTGLGLAVSKSLCDLLGYTLEVRSEVGVGSMFSVILTPSARLGRGDWPLPADRGVPAEASPLGH